ncbi:unnamed protein product [Colias eurytheme]|nr:unnamed protein product [Colias eurytheme]
MGDNLPLLPTKGDTIYADVRPVLRDVFRGAAGATLVSCYHEIGETLQGKEWIENFKSECKEIYLKEKDLQKQYAVRLTREPLPNIYKTYPPDVARKESKEPYIDRKDLRPGIEQDAGRDARLWIQNILNKSSGDVTAQNFESRVQKQNAVVQMDTTAFTDLSLSIGDTIPRPVLPPPRMSPPPPLPEYIICVPPHIDFVNFTVGQVHTQSLRLINVSKFELRISVTPPTRRELKIELCSRLTVTSGAAAELLLHYKPDDVRALVDELHVRVSAGKGLCVPISCYMQPPVLEILVPNLTSSSHLDTMSAASVTHDVLDLGSRLLGDVHRVPLLFCCMEKHATFFLLAEEAWLNCIIDIATGKNPGVSSDCFHITPIRIHGGGRTRALCTCRAPTVGLHVTALRILCSTAIVRTLSVVADALAYQEDHVILQAHDKDYDICSEDDPACEYYVRLGTAFPNRSLSATVQIVNNSPITYPYYWSVRPWGVCSCWNGSDTSLLAEDDLCDDGKEGRRNQMDGKPNMDARSVRVEPALGRLFPRTTTQLLVRVPDVGPVLGVGRAVLMLILKMIPKESFPENYDPMIVKTDVIEEEAIPGVCPSWSREVCDIVCCQLEVWWEVVPVRFVLDPPVLRLAHSRRIKSTDICLHATQLYGVSGIKANWNVPVPKTMNLIPGESIPTNFQLQMPLLPNHYPKTDIIELIADNKEWKSASVIERSYNTRHPALRPAVQWLGIFPPGARVQTELVLHNDTYEHIHWWARCVRWLSGRSPARVCATRPPCVRCGERTCACAALGPSRGGLGGGERRVLKYSVVAPDTDGPVATLVQVHRTQADVCTIHTAAGTSARATLLLYRVLAPRVVVGVRSCGGDRARCKVCSLDLNSQDYRAVLRPSFALTVGFKSCYILKCTNLTPIPTTVKWQKPIEGEDSLRITFLPNDFDVDAYASIEIQVVLEPRKVCARRMYLASAKVTHAYKPIYLVVDAAIMGLEVFVDIPLGDAEKSDSFLTIKMIQGLTDLENVKPEQTYHLQSQKRA